MRIKSPGFLYRCISLLLVLFWVIHAIRHGLKHGVSGYLCLRTALLDARDSEAKIWVHASSVGEVQSVSPLVQALLKAKHPVLFTSFTATGFKTIQRNFPGRVEAALIPIDFYWFCRRFFRKHNIKAGLIMETELWPEVLYQARQHSIPLLQVNARLSKKSSEQSKYIRRLLLNTLSYFSAILTRSQRDFGHFQDLGVEADRIEIIGNMKSLLHQRTERPRLLQRDYLLLASSHEGEEIAFLQARPDSLATGLIVLAPRHPERSEMLQQELSRLGFNYAVRSKSESVTEATQVYLADTLGELMSFMAHAQMVIMGGSFDSTGGHNLLEPASLGCTIITGPSDSNIIEDIEMLGAGSGLLQVNDMEACWQAVSQLTDNPQQADDLASEAHHRLSQQPDIIDKYMIAIKPWLQPDGSDRVQL